MWSNFLKMLNLKKPLINYNNAASVCNKFDFKSLYYVGIIVFFLLTAAFTTSVASAEHLSFFSNGSIRYYTLPEMEFGSNVSEDKLLSLDQTQPKHVYVQFCEIQKNTEQLNLLDNYGIRRLRKTVGEPTTYITSMPASLTAADIPAEIRMCWMGEIPPEDKWFYENSEIPERARLPGGMVIVWVQMHEDVSLNDSRELYEKYANNSSLDIQYSRGDWLDPGFIFHFVTEENNLASIAEEDIVYRISYIDPSEPENTEKRNYNLVFSSNGSTRKFVPPEMEFGASVSDTSQPFFLKQSVSPQTHKRAYIWFSSMRSYRDEDKIAQWMSNNSITIVEPTIGNYGGIALVPISLTSKSLPENLYLRWGGEVVPGDRKHMYIQFKEEYPTQEQQILLGNFSIAILDSIGGYGTWIASMPASMNPADIPAEAGLRWMGVIPVGDKCGSNKLEAPDSARLDSGLIVVDIDFYDDVTLRDARELLHKYATNSSEYTSYSPVNESNFLAGYKFVTEEHNIELIANEDIVSRIGYLVYPDTIPEDYEYSEVTDDIEYIDVADDIEYSDIATLSDEQESNVTVSSFEEDNESQQVPGFSVLCSMNAFILLYFMRYRI